MNHHRPFVPSMSYAAIHLFPLAAVFLTAFLFIHVFNSTPLASHPRRPLLPTARSASAYLDGPRIVHIKVLYDGSVFLDGRWYPLPELPAAISAALSAAPVLPDVGLVLSLDRSLPFSSVRRVLRLLSVAGASRVTLAVEPTPDTPFLPGT